VQEEQRLLRRRGIAIVAHAKKFTKKRTATKEHRPDAIRVPVARSSVVGLVILAVRWHHAVTKVRVVQRVLMSEVAKRVSRVEIKRAVKAKVRVVRRVPMFAWVATKVSHTEIKLAMGTKVDPV
tara:strand:- start:298 stop:669 length:372 start_codon:yes stop_codon:yes gene_type:complete